MAASHVVPRVRTDSASPFDLANEWNHEQKVESRYLPRTRDSPERRQKGRWGRDIKARRGRGYQQRSVLKKRSASKDARAWCTSPAGVRTGPSRPTAAHATATRTRPDENPVQKSRVERVAMAVKSCRPSAWGSVGVRVGVGVRVRVGVRVEVRVRVRVKRCRPG